jgi:hypothetical protein
MGPVSLTDASRAILRHLYPEGHTIPLAQAMTDVAAVLALEKTLRAALEQATTGDDVNLRMVAAVLLKHMREHQR